MICITYERKIARKNILTLMSLELCAQSVKRAPPSRNFLPQLTENWLKNGWQSIYNRLPTNESAYVDMLFRRKNDCECFSNILWYFSLFPGWIWLEIGKLKTKILNFLNVCSLQRHDITSSNSLQRAGCLTSALSAIRSGWIMSFSNWQSQSVSQSVILTRFYSSNCRQSM